MLLVAGLASAVFAVVRLSAPDEVAVDAGDPQVAAADLGETVARNQRPDRVSRAEARVTSASTPQPVIQARTLVLTEQAVPLRKRVEKTAREVEDAAKSKGKPKPEPEPEPDAPFDVAIGTFNVLGSQHTAPGGDRTRYPPAATRSAGAAAAILAHGVDVVGTQELQADQLAALRARTGMAAWPGLAWGSVETDNSILYDDSRFAFVSGSSFSITFMGRSRPQAILRLQDRATGREFYVVNTHPSAGGGQYAAERARGRATLVGVVNNLRTTTGLPVFVTGDMNDRELFYCNAAPAASLTAPNGGSYSSGCRPPASPLPVDWVVGAGPITWSNYWRDTSVPARRISDHYFISATAHVQ